MTWAYEFRCAKPLDQLEAALNEAGPWPWQARDSYWYGDYLNSRPSPGVRVRIHEEGGGMLDWWAARLQGGRGEVPEAGSRQGDHRYTALVDMEDVSGVDRAVIDNVLLSVLRVAGAQDIREIKPYD